MSVHVSRSTNLLIIVLDISVIANAVDDMSNMRSLRVVTILYILYWAVSTRRGTRHNTCSICVWFNVYARSLPALQKSQPSLLTELPHNFSRLQRFEMPTYPLHLQNACMVCRVPAGDSAGRILALSKIESQLITIYARHCM